MKTAIVYYSYTGNTRKVAELVQKKLDCDIIEIKPKKDIKEKGFASYVTGGLRSMKKEAPELMEYSFNQNDYDFIILASPVWAFTYAPTMRSFMEKEKIQGKKVSCMLTHKGDPKKSLSKFVDALSGNEVWKGISLNGDAPLQENEVLIDAWLKEIA